MTLDPFADEAPEGQAPADQEQNWDASPPAATPEPGSGDTGRRVRVTLKGGTAHDAPWITIDGADVPDALDQLTTHAADVKALVDQVAKVGRYFAATSATPRPPGNGTTTQTPTKPAHQEAPGGERRYCEHGEMPYRSGVSKNGNTYKGFFCSETDRSQQCKPQFVK